MEKQNKMNKNSEKFENMSQATNILEMKRQLHDTNEAFLIQKRKYIEEDVKFREKVRKLEERDTHYQLYLMQYQKDLLKQRNLINELKVRHFEMAKQNDKITEEIAIKKQDIERKENDLSMERKKKKKEENWEKFIEKIVTQELKAQEHWTPDKTPTQAEISTILEGQKVTRDEITKLKDEYEEKRKKEEKLNEEIRELKARRLEMNNDSSEEVQDIMEQIVSLPDQKDSTEKIEQGYIDTCINISLLLSTQREKMAESKKKDGKGAKQDKENPLQDLDEPDMKKRQKDTMDSLRFLEKIVQAWDRTRNDIKTKTENDRKDKEVRRDHR